VCGLFVKGTRGRSCLGTREKLILVGEQPETESRYLIFDKVCASSKEFLSSLW
jgi:hypothetical protein